MRSFLKFLPGRLLVMSSGTPAHAADVRRRICWNPKEPASLRRRLQRLGRVWPELTINLPNPFAAVYTSAQMPRSSLAQPRHEADAAHALPVRASALSTVFILHAETSATRAAAISSHAKILFPCAEAVSSREAMKTPRNPTIASRGKIISPCKVTATSRGKTVFPHAEIVSSHAKIIPSDPEMVKTSHFSPDPPVFTLHFA